ncbi:SRPBCC domain-containing protein [Caulobacter mirabilis]|uniref:ATPase n=1 Tax=Caulobacter mirabilis TaxID=69666 RepID=A0A2D2AX46_9CAUL|nr:SRPBCC domain-containing protein [Caulobacter mirabilis]ATQ42584.1 ATPase [Caulobacter mirabilis]
MASRVVVALRVKVPPQRAFQAFTEEIGAWWKPNALFAFTPREPGLLSFDGRERLIETRAGGKVFEIGRVKVWEPGARLVFGWRQATFTPEMATQVEVTFEPVGEGETRVTVTHVGWDSVPQDHVARHGFPLQVIQARQGEWWRTLLERLRERVE